MLGGRSGLQICNVEERREEEEGNACEEEERKNKNVKLES